MSHKFLIFNTESKAQEFVGKADIEMGYPKDNKSLRYTSVVKHPTDGRAICLTCPKCYSLLTQAQIDSLIDVRDPSTVEFFPDLVGLL